MLTRGVGRAHGPTARRSQERGGVSVHRVREPGWPRDLDRFVAWVEQMNEDMLRGRRGAGAGARLRPRARPRLAGRARGCDAGRPARGAVRDDDPRDRARAPPGLGGGRAAVAHPRGRALDGPARGRGDRLLVLHARSRRGHLRHRRAAGDGDPQRGRPERTAPGGRPAGAARASSRSRRRSSCCWSGGSFTRRAFSWRWTRSRA